MYRDPDFPEEHRLEALARGRGLPAARDEDPGSSGDWAVSRRTFVKGAGAISGAALLGWSAFPVTAETQAGVDAPVQQVPITITINGEQKNLSIDPRISVLDLLREDLKMTGTKKGLRSWPMRRLHGAVEWTPREQLPGAGDCSSGRTRHHD